MIQESNTYVLLQKYDISKQDDKMIHLSVFKGNLPYEHLWTKDKPVEQIHATSIYVIIDQLIEKGYNYISDSEVVKDIFTTPSDKVVKGDSVREGVGLEMLVQFHNSFKIKSGLNKSNKK